MIRRLTLPHHYWSTDYRYCITLIFPSKCRTAHSSDLMECEITSRQRDCVREASVHIERGLDLSVLANLYLLVRSPNNQHVRSNPFHLSQSRIKIYSQTRFTKCTLGTCIRGIATGRISYAILCRCSGRPGRSDAAEIR